MFINFHFHIPKSFRTKFGKNVPVLSAKIRFSFSYVHDLGPRSKNDIRLTLKNHIPSFTQLVVCISQLSVHRLY